MQASRKDGEYSLRGAGAGRGGRVMASAVRWRVACHRHRARAPSTTSTIRSTGARGPERKRTEPHVYVYERAILKK